MARFASSQRALSSSACPSRKWVIYGDSVAFGRDALRPPTHRHDKGESERESQDEIHFARFILILFPALRCGLVLFPILYSSELFPWIGFSP